MAGRNRLPIIIPLLECKDEVRLDELDEHILLLEAARHHLDVEWTQSLGEFEARDGHDVFGYASLVAYLKDRTRMAGSRANRYVSIARMARRFGATLSSWKHRQIQSDQAEQLFKAAERMPDRYPEAESVLLEIAGDTPDETRKMLDYWTNEDERSNSGLADQLARRRFDYRRKANGMLEGEFLMTETAGQALLTSLDAVAGPPDSADDRNASQRHHDAVEDLANGFLRSSDAPVVGGERPHINVLVDVEALTGSGGGLHETEEGHVLDLESLRLLGCDSSLSRIVLKGQSEILDVGRRTRVIPVALRRAVIARDRCCTWAGCTRQPRWCDVHHIVSWADGGETAMPNLCLLCRYHHTMVHQADIELAEDGSWRFTLQSAAIHRPT